LWVKVPLLTKPASQTLPLSLSSLLTVEIMNCKHKYMQSYSDMEGVSLFCVCGYFKFIEFKDMFLKIKSL